MSSGLCTVFLLVAFIEVAVAAVLSGCNVSPDLVTEIESYQGNVNTIIETVLRGDYRGKVYEELARFVDKFGSRFPGTENLENAIDYILRNLSYAELNNVHGEPVSIPRWVRGHEEGELLMPLRTPIRIMAVGGSTGTPPEGLIAEAVVVRNFDDLKSLGKEGVRGKIVVYNQGFVNYRNSVVYRSLGGDEAAKFGAVAALVRSVTTESIYSAHAGSSKDMHYATKIPTASITIEDTDMLTRMYNRGDMIIIRLKMEAHFEGNGTSRNIIADLTGSEQPQSKVILSGHIDSWDVGKGAMDDGGGAFISWMALDLLKSLNLVPKRTVRSILWTAEEIGMLGAYEYQKVHKDDDKNINLLMESDEGTFLPLGLGFGGNREAACILSHVLELLQSIGANRLELLSPEMVGSDIYIWKNVNKASLIPQNEKYFWYHHTEGDTMTLENPTDLDMSLVVWASTAYVVADLSTDLPK